MRSSWPGIGLTMTITRPEASASELVSPPAFPTRRSEAAIHRSISVVNPTTFTGWAGAGSSSRRRFSSGFFPHTTATWMGWRTSCRAFARDSTGPIPNPPAETRIVVRSGWSPSSRRVSAFSLAGEKAGSMGIPVTWIVSGGIPSATMWTFVSSHATKYQSTPRYNHMAWRS